MKPIETKYDKIGTGEPANNEKVFASEINSIASELENAVASGGQALDEANNYQLAMSITDHALGARHSVDTGTVNNYILSQTGSRYAPTTLVAGYVLEFFTGNANTTTTPTLNYATLGVKTIVAQDGTTSIAVGDIKVGVLNTVKYDGTNWRLILPVVNLASQTVSGISYINKQITISNNATDANNDIDFTSGTFTFSDYTGMASVGAMTKRLDASWTAGTNQGGLDTGSKANSTWYHCYAIYNPTSSVSDAIFSNNATTPTLPSGYTKYKYLGSVLTSITSNIIAFQQTGDFFEWKDVIRDLNTTSIAATKTAVVISTPFGVKTIAVCRAGLFAQDTNDVSINILSGYNNSLLPPNGDGNTYDADIGSDIGYVAGTNLLVTTNLNSQIYYIASRAGTVNAFVIRTKGYFNYSI